MSVLFNITSRVNAVLASLAGSGGAGILGWIQTGAGAVFRWVLDKLRETVSVLDFGADPTGTVDSWAALQAAHDTGKMVYYPQGTYLTSKPIEVTRLQMRGDGPSLSFVKKTTNTVGATGFTSVAAISAVTDIYNVDSIYSIRHPASGYYYGHFCEGIALIGLSNVSRNTYGIYAPRAANVVLDRVEGTWLQKVYFTYSTFLSEFRHLQGYSCNTVFETANDGFGTTLNTSIVGTNCAGNACTDTYKIYGLTYSTFNSCTSDSGLTSVWTFQNCANIICNGCGMESNTGSNISVINCNTPITFNSGYTYNHVGAAGIPAISVSNGILLLKGSSFSNFATVNMAKNYAVTGSAGFASVLSLELSSLPMNGSVGTIDGYSVVLQDSAAERTNFRGKTGVVSVHERLTVDTSTVVFLKNGVFTAAGVPTYTYKQINNTVYFTVSMTCTVSGAGAGSIILDVPFTLAADSVFGSAFAGGSAAAVYQYSVTQIRADLTAAAGATKITFVGTMNL